MNNDEINERVAFKLNEILDATKNNCDLYWGAAFNNKHPRYYYYWEAFTEFKKIILKEINLPVPYNDMAENKRKKKNNIVIEKLRDLLLKRGEKDYDLKLKRIVNIINNL